jgi:hypothetical protein
MIVSLNLELVYAVPNSEASNYLIKLTLDYLHHLHIIVSNKAI